MEYCLIIETNSVYSGSFAVTHSFSRCNSRSGWVDKRWTRRSRTHSNHSLKASISFRSSRNHKKTDKNP